MSDNKNKFRTTKRVESLYRDVEERKLDYKEVEQALSVDELQEQADRCMNCGIPFCHGVGCPLQNNIPDMNRAVSNGEWLHAYQILSEKSPFPEFTSKICPALCEESCTASISFGGVMVRQIEKMIIDTAFENGYVKPIIPMQRNSKKVAVIGAGPAGMATADYLNRLGYNVEVFEAKSAGGGLLRYGIPKFKLDKAIIDRRINILKEAGIKFSFNTEIGKDISSDYLSRMFDAVVITIGTPIARNLNIDGREFNNIHYALEFLGESDINVENKNVLVIGGGDTGSDCVGTSIRQNAKSITQIEIMPQPPEDRSESTPWPNWSYKLRTSSSHKEGGERRWSLQSLKFIGDKNNNVTSTIVKEVKWNFDLYGKPLNFVEIENSQEELNSDIVFLAMGFLKQSREELLTSLNMSDKANVFISGDAANGPSLVVRAIVDAKNVVEKVDKYLKEL